MYIDEKKKEPMWYILVKNRFSWIRKFMFTEYLYLNLYYAY